jgi:hypothetical protein
MIVENLGKVTNFDQLVTETLSFINEIPHDKNQISCQLASDDSTNLEESSGSLLDLPVQLETSYKHIPSILKGSFLEKIILEHNAFRTRIMIMDPRKCYSVHRDLTKRIHIPIVTNSQCWMIWPRDNFCFQLSKGEIYLTDTTKWHTFINGDGELKRIHIVMGVSR